LNISNEETEPELTTFMGQERNVEKGRERLTLSGGPHTPDSGLLPPIGLNNS
ncbi:hypothetical protein P7K49_013362, partial [Saguinus oedipus]